MTRSYAPKLTLLFVCACVGAQIVPNAVDGVGHSSTLTFVMTDRTCVRGTISKADSTSITVLPFKQVIVSVQREKLLQVSQGNALLFSARSSWIDVVNTHLYPREFLVVNNKDGKQVKGTMMSVVPDGITIRHGLTNSVFPKSVVASVDYFRWKPATDGFNLALEEAPFAVIFYPEFYGRLAGIEGKIGVRLYDAGKPEDNSKINLRACFQ